MSIGEMIRNRRIELGLTQEELAERMGYTSKTSINKIELGINDIPLSKVCQFAKALSTTEAYLMEWDASSSSSQDPAGTLSESEKHLINSYRRLDHDDQQRLTGYLDALLNSGKYNDSFGSDEKVI